jgi:hypothetical protein
MIVMDFIINTYESVGPIRFGMPQPEVHEILGRPLGTNRQSPKMFEVFHGLIQVSYTNMDPLTCIAVQFNRDSDKLIQPCVPIFQGKNLFDGTSIEELKCWFETMDESVNVEVDGLTAYGLGIGLGTKSYKLFSDEPPKTVIAFTRGAYDDDDSDSSYNYWAARSGLNELLTRQRRTVQREEDD